MPETKHYISEKDFQEWTIKAFKEGFREGLRYAKTNSNTPDRQEWIRCLHEFRERHKAPF